MVDGFGGLLPRLDTAIPGPRSVGLAAELARVECPALTVRRAMRAEQGGASLDPITWSEAHGANVRDVDGNVFVDLTAGFGAALIGHSHWRVVKAVNEQVGRLPHALGDVHPSEQKVRLLSALAELAPWPARSILGLSGSDAVEAALKTAMLHTGNPGVVAFVGGYHGLSHAPLAACGYGEGFRLPFAAQLNPHVRFADYPTQSGQLEGSLASIERAIATLTVRLGAILVEPIQGRGGVRVPPEGFMRRLSAFAREHRALLIVDEIYTGLGRAGATFLHVEQEGSADLICLGKALGGGMPVSACLGREEIMAAWGTPGGEALHTSTFLGNPPACAAALACLTTLRELDAPRYALARGDALRSALAAKSIGVRGRGLLLGVELASSAEVLRASRRLLERGYITTPAGAPPSVLCLTPPLSITDEQIEGFARALSVVLNEAVA